MLENKCSNIDGMPERMLPKNYRQIGEPGKKKIYVEDYVYTYLNKLARPGNIYARGAILFGRQYKTEQGKCLFISGACACQNFEFDLENTTITEEVWKEIYRLRDQYFKEQEVVGWFLSRMGFSVGLNDKIIKAHIDNFGGENKVLYLVDALEHEDAFYQMESFSLKRQGGYYLYYESNEPMKNYMLGEEPYDLEEEEGTLKEKTLNRDAAVLRNYRNLLRQKKCVKPKEEKTYHPVVVAAGTVAAVLALMYGVYTSQFFGKSLKETSVFSHQEKKSEGETFVSTFYNSQESTETGGDELLPEEETQDRNDIYNEENTYNIEETQMDTEQETTEDTSVFSEEEPDDVTEAWSYIGGYYTVQKGDTLAGISKKIYQTDEYVLKIAEKNGIMNINEIYPGQVLYIPEMND